MQAILDVSIPVFAIILTGYLSGRLKLLGQDSTAALNGFVYFIALPALFVSSTATSPVREVLDWSLFGVVIGGYVATAIPIAIIARIFFSKRIGEVTLHTGSSVFANNGYMGIPLALAAFGDGAMTAIVASVIANIVLVLGVASALMEVDRTGATGPRMIVDAFRGLVRSPLLWAFAIGMAISAAGLTIPSPALRFMEMLGSAASPCALFAMGLFLVGQAVHKGAGEVAWISAIKLFVHPAATWLIAQYLIDVNAVQEGVSVLMASLPTGGLIFVLAQRYGVFVQRATAVILVSTVVSVVTVSYVLQYYVPIVRAYLG